MHTGHVCGPDEYALEIWATIDGIEAVAAFIADAVAVAAFSVFKAEATKYSTPTGVMPVVFEVINVEGTEIDDGGGNVVAIGIAAVIGITD